MEDVDDDDLLVQFHAPIAALIGAFAGRVTAAAESHMNGRPPCDYQRRRTIAVGRLVQRGATQLRDFGRGEHWNDFMFLDDWVEDGLALAAGRPVGYAGGAVELTTKKIKCWARGATDYVGDAASVERYIEIERVRKAAKRRELFEDRELFVQILTNEGVPQAHAERMADTVATEAARRRDAKAAPPIPDDRHAKVLAALSRVRLGKRVHEISRATGIERSQAGQIVSDLVALKYATRKGPRSPVVTTTAGEAYLAALRQH